MSPKQRTDNDAHRGPRPLAALCGAPMETGRFLVLAAGIAEALAKLHQEGEIHAGLNPHCILVDESTTSVTLTSLSGKRHLPYGHPSVGNLPENEIPPPYMSPEQTGRMNRGVDQRTDLYSLGVIFYQMATGELPFLATDLTEWVHCHIAHTARPPGELAPHLPQQVSDIIMRLLAKDAQDRYLSAAGLAADLRRCLAQWRSAGKVAPFPLGEEDISERLLIPHKIYGRQRERDVLIAAFNRVATQGTAEVVMVSGYAGTGKTSLVRELYQPVTRERGSFLTGKFDQLERDVPYATVAEAFRGRIEQILAESEERIAQWKEQLEKALGPNAQLMVEVIPELQLIVGAQPAAPKVPPTETRNRFHMVFRHFLSLFANKEHAVVLFLDDLQWADVATLKLIEHLMTHPDTGYLLLIGAYRDNEVGPFHPLLASLQELHERGAALSVINLLPLALQDLGHMIADAACAGKAERCAPLTRLVHEKTGGNPFFAIQFLTALYQEGLLEFDRGRKMWLWDLERIRGKGYTDNVVDLMVQKLKKLASHTLEEVKLAACIGNRVDLETITMISGLSTEESRDTLDQAVNEGLMLRFNGDYSFLHDRVQEAAYSLLPQENRIVTHLKIGRLLVTQLSPEALEERVFDVVNQLNLGVALIESEEEKESLRRLNELAGRRAKSSIAYRCAANYLERGASLLPPDAWESRYQETFSLRLELFECQYLSGRFVEADAAFALIYDHARSDLDRTRVLRLRGKLYETMGRFSDALALALDALRLLGVTLPQGEEALLAAFAEEMAQIESSLGGRAVAELAEAPQATDPYGIMIIGLLVDALAYSYAAAPPYFHVLAAKGVNYSLRYGYTAESCMAYNSYAIVLIALYWDMKKAWEFSSMTGRLVEKVADPVVEGLFLAGHAGLVLPWRRHLAGSVPLLEKAVGQLLGAGDFVSASHCLMLALWAEVETAETLDQVAGSIERHQKTTKEIHNDTIYRTIGAVRQFVASLKGATRAPASFDDGAFSEADCIAHFTALSWHAGLAYFHVMKLIAAVVYRRDAEALLEALRAEPVLRLMMAMPVAGTMCFFHALALTALNPKQSPEQQRGGAETLAALSKKLEHWAEGCPENQENRYALVAAELARLDGRYLEAEALYEQAIRSARQNRFVMNEALALERAAQFYGARGFESFARCYLREARDCYTRWGAHGKVKQLEQENAWLVVQETVEAMPLGERLGRIDAVAVTKASQAISSEIELDRLLDTLMRITLQNAGAQKGCLLLMHDGEPTVEVEAFLEESRLVVRRPAPAPSSETVPSSLVNYVSRTRQSVIMDDPAREGVFKADPYLARLRPLSVLCLPIVRQADLVGLLYLENSSVAGAFTAERVAVLEVLAGQAAISIENALLYVGIQQENRERRRAEAELSGLMETAPDAMVTVNEAGEIHFANAQAEQLFGYRREELFGQRVEMLIPEEYRSRHVGRRDAYMKNPQVRHLATEPGLFGLRKDGTVFPADISLSPLSTASGLMVTATVRDVSEAKLAQTALQDSEQRYRQLSETLEQRVNDAVEELNQKNKLLIVQSRQAVMGEMISNIAHQWRQPLNALGLLAQELQVMFRLEQFSKEYLDTTVKRIMELIRHMSKTIDDFRFFFRPTRELARFRVLDVLEKTLSLLGGSLEANGIETHIDAADDPEIEGYPNEFSQVLLNIIINAKDAFMAGATADRLVSIDVRMRDGKTVVTITDNAGGIPPEIIDKIFEPYFTTKGPEQGTGVGLFMCKTIIEKNMRGTLRARNVKDGAQFIIEV